jgi:glyoxylase-like metal-dependent hydrolase (beta-lactamase superfamily II)
VEELLAGVWHWSAPHPRIKFQVHSHWISDARVVFDPIEPVDGLPELDPAPSRIVLSCRLHSRDSERFAEAFGDVPILVPEAGIHEFEGEEGIGSYAPGDEIAPGVTAEPMGAIAPDDTVLHIRARGEGLLLFADALLVWDGELSFQPDFLMDDPEQVKEATLERIDELLMLDFDHLLLAHGEPIIGRGRTALAEFAENPRSADFGV